MSATVCPLCGHRWHGEAVCTVALEPERGDASRLLLCPVRACSGAPRATGSLDWAGGTPIARSLTGALTLYPGAVEKLRRVFGVLSTQAAGASDRCGLCRGRAGHTADCDAEEVEQWLRT